MEIRDPNLQARKSICYANYDHCLQASTSVCYAIHNSFSAPSFNDAVTYVNVLRHDYIIKCAAPTLALIERLVFTTDHSALAPANSIQSSMHAQREAEDPTYKAPNNFTQGTRTYNP